MIIENLSTFKIHKLSQEQYNRALENGNINENALYLTPDESVMVISAENYGDSLPAAGIIGRVFFKKVDL